MSELWRNRTRDEVFFLHRHLTCRQLLFANVCSRQDSVDARLNETVLRLEVIIRMKVPRMPQKLMNAIIVDNTVPADRALSVASRKTISVITEEPL